MRPHRKRVTILSAFGRFLPVAICAFLLGAKNPHATLRVSGLGWLKNRELRLSLERLLGNQIGPTVATNTIEDAAFLLEAAVQQEGFLRDEIEIEVEAADGQRGKFRFDSTLMSPLPRDLAAKSVEFKIASGVRFEFSQVEIRGLHALPVQKVRSYFIPSNALFGNGLARAYTPTRLARDLDNIREELRDKGYADAVLAVGDFKREDISGKISLVLNINEGPLYRVRSLSVAGHGTEGFPATVLDGEKDVPWSPLWQQDVRERVRRFFLQSGFPDTRVVLRETNGEIIGGIRPVDAVLQVGEGTFVEVGKIRFEGLVHTRERMLRHRVDLRPGDPLDPLALEQSRYRIGRLGIFSSVDLKYEPASGPARDPVFAVEEAPRTETSLLFGYGSYEELRGGVETRQLNLWGLAHQSRLDLVQSLKSSRGEYNYTIPEIFGGSTDATLRLFGLRREEQSFLREEYGATLALKTPLPFWNIDASAGYTLQHLRNADDDLSSSGTDGSDVDVASIDLGLTRDRRDNPLRPRRGIRWFGDLELATRNLGGQADYQRFEGGVAYHTSWGDGRWIHVGLTHGVITTYGAHDDSNLPVNKRFFPGGDSSIRGYQEGQAAPRGPDGRFLGAKSYVLGNAELEQAVTPNWSGVVFFDALGTAASLAKYPFDEKLYSVGLGVRYQTLIGPIRLEYGRNVNPRRNDPVGTLNFSVGYPF